MSESVSTKLGSFPCICPVTLCEGLACLLVLFSLVEASGTSITGEWRCIWLLAGEGVGVAAGEGLATGLGV